MAIISISDSQINGANQILVTDGSSKIPAKDGSQITVLNATNVASGTIATARLDTGTTAGKLVVLDGSGNLPAVDASLLTGIVSATISASDPTLSTNPSGGVGTEWNNSTTGEMYICTDATAGANVWKNVGAGSGNIIRFPGWGSTYGFSTGGARSIGNPCNRIDRFSFTSDGNATDFGDLTISVSGNVGQADTSHGYNVAGQTGGTQRNEIERFAFASAGNGVDVGDITVARGEGPSGSYDSTHGYIAGGNTTNVIDRYAFAASSNAVDVGDLVQNANGSGGATSFTHGYHFGGNSSNATNLYKYSYAASGNASDVGDMYQGTSANGENGNSETHGYAMGGHYGGAYINVVQKWAFATDGTTTDVGDLLFTGNSCNHASSTTHVYCVNGGNASSQYQHIQKVPFATDGNMTDVGDLTAGAQTSCGTVNQ